MSDSTTPDDARKAVDELEEKIVNDPEQPGDPEQAGDPGQEGSSPGGMSRGDESKATPGTEEPPD